jgi:predicted nucleotidyltransferase
MAFEPDQAEAATSRPLTPDGAAVALPLLVQRAVGRLIRAFAPERIMLFGSHVKGTAHQGSDVDLLVVASLAGKPAIHARRARQLAADSFPRIDMVFATPQEIENADTARSPFLLSILSTGVDIYRKS